jgi:hypothetical protein
MVFKLRTAGKECPYFDYSTKAIQHISLCPAVEQFLELARGQRPRRRLPEAASIAGGINGKVAGCRKRPVSIVRGMHG